MNKVFNLIVAWVVYSGINEKDTNGNYVHPILHALLIIVELVLAGIGLLIVLSIIGWWRAFTGN